MAKSVRDQAWLNIVSRGTLCVESAGSSRAPFGAKGRGTKTERAHGKTPLYPTTATATRREEELGEIKILRFFPHSSNKVRFRGKKSKHFDHSTSISDSCMLRNAQNGARSIPITIRF